MLDAAALRVIRPEDETRDVEQARGEGAHRARLEGHHELAARKPFLTEPPRSAAESEHFGMCGRVVPRLHFVAGGSEKAPLGIEDRGPHRHLAPRPRPLRFRQSPRHPPAQRAERAKETERAERSSGALLSLFPPVFLLSSHAGGFSTSAMAHRPLIGLTLDREEAGGYSRWPWYALRVNYAEAVAEAGGVPVALPLLEETAEALIGRLDGLIITGGAFDIDPALYGEGETHPAVSLKTARTRAERALLAQALARDLPVLGICGGEQLLAVALGGTLIQHIPDAIPEALPHEGHEPGHEVRLIPGTLLARIAGVETMRVNSSHHQAVRTPGRAVINAVAPDGVIEGIEDPQRRFCLGVQWHPEFFTDPSDRRIFEAFIAACHDG
jgi:putative glutamine amidotransferase